MSSPQNLFDELCTVDHLFLAWKNLNKTNLGSFGLTGESVQDFRSNLDANLENLSKLLSSRKFEFSAARPYLIAKDNGKFRPLQIPEVKDRVVLKALAIILERELQSLIQPSEGVSFAYQKRIGIKDALLKIKEYYEKGDKYVYEADIIDFFGTVNRNVLLETIFSHLPDKTINDLIKSGITPKVDGLNQIAEEHRKLFEDKGGIPQGNALSPLFSNIYLAPFDSEMKKLNYHLVRYADDFVIMCSTNEQARLAYEKSREYLQSSLSLQIHKLGEEATSKTRIIDPEKHVFSFLSVSFDGKQLFPSVKNKNEFIEKLMALCNAGKKGDIITLLNKVKNSHDGWISTFLFCDVPRYFEEIDWMINAGVYKYLKGCGWKLQKKSLGKLPTRFRKIGTKVLESGECLSEEKRKNSGILLSKDLYKLRMPKLIKSSSKS